MNPFRKAGLKALRQLNSLYKAPRQRRAVAAFHALQIGPGDLIIDCGANVGEITAGLARTGATVHAFEPNPVAFEVLKRETGSLPNVILHPCAVSDRAGTVTLYLHRHLAADPLGHSAGSSLMSGKHNLDPNNSIQVSAVDLAHFIDELPGPVRVLKIDVEGLEAVLLNHLLDRGMLGKVDQVFCETHEFKVPGLLAECRALRRRLAREGITHVNLDWA